MDYEKFAKDIKPFHHQVSDLRHHYNSMLKDIRMKFNKEFDIHKLVKEFLAENRDCILQASTCHDEPNSVYVFTNDDKFCQRANDFKKNVLSKVHEILYFDADYDTNEVDLRCLLPNHMPDPDGKDFKEHFELYDF